MLNTHISNIDVLRVAVEELKRVLAVVVYQSKLQALQYFYWTQVPVIFHDIASENYFVNMSVLFIVDVKQM